MDFEDPARIDPPCIAICSFFPETRVCRGCFRTREEIWHWKSFNRAQHKDILRKTEIRKSDYLKGEAFSV